MRIQTGLYISLIILLSAAIYGVVGQWQPEEIHKSVNENLQTILQAQQQDIDDFEHEFAVYTNPFAIPHDNLFAKRVYVNGGLVYWSDNEYYPDYNSLKQPDTLYTLTDSHGIWLVKRRQVVTDRTLIEIFSIIPVLKSPAVSNQYLKKSLNPLIFESYELSIVPNGSYQFKYAGQTFFSAEILPQTTVQREQLGFILILLLGIVIIGLMQTLGKRHISWPVFWVMAIGYMLFFRLSLYVFTQHQIVRWELFDPVYFTAGALNPSLGDLLLNGCLLFAVILSMYRVVASDLSWVSRSKYMRSWWTYGLLILCNLLLFHFMYEATWLLLEHSQLQLDISESITFNTLRLSAYLFIVLSGLSVLVFFSLSQLMLFNMQGKKWLQYLFTLVFYVIVAALADGNAFVYLAVFPVLWMLVDFLKLNKTIQVLRYQTFIFLVLVFTGVSMIVAFSIYKHYEKDDLVAKEKFANRLLIRNDILGEFYLSQIMSEIADDRYIRTRLMSKVLARQNIREKIKRQFLSSYFKKYDINVYLFDANGNSLQQDAQRDYESWQAEYARPEYDTDYDGIYFVEDRQENVRNKYVCFLNIAAYGRQVGYIVLDLTLKKYIPSSVFPELLLESKYYIGSKEEFDYAVLQNGEILYKQGRHSFENALTREMLQSELLYGKGIESGGFHYSGLKTVDGRTIVIVSPTYEFQAILANFSFVFLLLVFVSGFAFLIARMLSSGHGFNLSTKIQVYLGLSFLLPMLVVSVALINTLNTSYRDEIDRNFQKRSYNIAENILDESEAFFSNQINIDQYANEIVKAAAIAQSDLNIYDVNGRLVTTSQPEIFRLGLLSRLLDTDAYYKIKFKREQNIIADQIIGTLDFKSSYTALRSYKDGRLLAFLSMPYFDSKNHLRRQQVEVFNNLVVIFSIIFLISLFGGNIIVGQLVRPLKRIGDKLRKTSLQETNQPIMYEAHDEIGTLVKEYNTMLVKLEESKEALAASQKESAWKEIARQVAHEIKNPLTPMRLKIQQMMRTFEAGSKQYATCEALIGQVDSLSSIADSFSEFAKMPAPNNEVVEVITTINKTIDLYQSAEVKLVKQYETESAHVYLDPRIFSRTLTNILLNAIQAQEHQQRPIRVSVRVQAGKVIIAIADSGSGIAEEQKEKIFTPYFSTKSKGSGIGLAVAKKGIENAGGNIWFDSEEGKGTTFFISLPVYQG